MIPPAVLTVPELAAYLKIGRTSAWKLVRTGAIPSSKILGSVRIPIKDVEEFLESRTARTPKELGRLSDRRTRQNRRARGRV